ncbi:MAG: hypothetical protein IT445_09025 [Phycisphaeraceae bacterium]|nr:hypothetical protein [Phycisphaeraceae bacterium]
MNPKLVLCEPFALVYGNVTGEWRPGLRDRQRIVRILAGHYGAVFVPCQQLFDDMTMDAPAACWLPDGVHPAPGAHRRMVALWTGCVTRVL